MKHLIVVAHAGVQQDLGDRLRSLEHVKGFTFTHTEGHGSHDVEQDPFLSTRDKVVGYVPRIRVDILLDDADVDPVITALRDPAYGIAGQGVYWVTSVDQNGRL